VPFLAPYGASIPQYVDIQTGAYRNERQLNYLPDGVWLKSLICGRKKRSFDHFAAFSFFLIHPHSPA